MGEACSMHGGDMKLWTKNPKGRALGRRPSYRWQDNIRMYLEEIEWKGVDWIRLARNKDQ